MLKHRVSNAGAHGQPQVIIRNAQQSQTVNQMPAPPKVQAPVPKPPRLQESFDEPLPPPPPELQSDDMVDYYQPANTGDLGQGLVEDRAVTSINSDGSYSQGLNGQNYNQYPQYPNNQASYQTTTTQSTVCITQSPYVPQQQPGHSQPYPQEHVLNGQQYVQAQPYNGQSYNQVQNSAHCQNGIQNEVSYNTQTPVTNTQSDNLQPQLQTQVTQNDCSYSSSQAGNSPAVKLPPGVTTSDNKAKEGIRIINEKYDSLGNLTNSPGRSPVGSPNVETSPMSFTDIVMSQKFREGVSEQDIMQADTFYRSHKSDVFVCGCLANMYTGSVKTTTSNEQWTFNATGIPLFLLDSGEHHRERKLYIILAEKGTGFTLWRDVVDNMTNYKTPNPNFHTLHMSKDHTKLAGLSFDEVDKAREFYRHLEKLTSDPSDDLLKIGKSKKKKSMKDKKKKIKLPKKTEISQPCCFVHVTKLERPMELDETEKVSSESNKEPLDANGISKPFNFQHVTATKGATTSGISNSESLPNMMGSKLTLTSSSSVDSGLSEDRSPKSVQS